MPGILSLRPLALALTALVMAGPALAQPVDLPLAAADGSPLPRGIRTGRVDGAPVYTDSAGHVLYGLDMRTVLRWSPDPARYCAAECRQTWQPVLAPKGSQPNIRFPADGRPRSEPGFVNPQQAPDWTVIAGAEGPQWVYKGWHLVFVRTDQAARSTRFDGADQRTWNTLKYIPPQPQIVAPPVVTVRYVGGAYHLADSEGHLLFTGTCPHPCTWRALAAPLASAGIGEWQVRSTEETAQWTLRNKPVFIADGTDAAALPPATQALRP